MFFLVLFGLLSATLLLYFYFLLFHIRRVLECRVLSPHVGTSVEIGILLTDKSCMTLYTQPYRDIVV